MRCGAVRCGAVRCGAVRCGVVQCAHEQCLAPPSLGDSGVGAVLLRCAALRSLRSATTAAVCEPILCAALCLERPMSTVRYRHCCLPPPLQLFDNALVAAGLLDDARTMLPRLNKLLSLLASPGTAARADPSFVAATKEATALPSPPNDPEAEEKRVQVG